MINDNVEKENENAKLLYMFKNLDSPAILNFKDFIAKLCAVSGSNLKINDLKFENIILIYLL